MIAANSQHRILWLPGEERMDSWDEDAPIRNSAGVRINAENAHSVSAVFACTRIRAETVASLPLHVYERTRGGGKRIARELPLYRQLHTQPNGWQTSFEWREQLVMHVDLWGDAFSELKAGKIEPLHPSRMKNDRVENGSLRYKYREASGQERLIAQDLILHIRGPSDDGVNGIKIVEECKAAIALARACELHGERFFAAGARPGFVLSTEGQLNAEAREMLRSQWNRRHGGVGNSHETAVLTGGLKPYDIPQSSNSDAQFLELRQYQLREIARLFRVPGYLLGLEPGTPQAEIEFVTHTIVPLLRRIETAMMRDLLGDDDRYLIEFDVRGLLRGDASSRAAYNRAMWDIGVVSTNDIRASENLDPVEGGDERYRPLNMGTLGAAPSPEDVLAQQQKGSGIDGQAVEGGLAAATGEAPAEPAAPSQPEGPQVADVSLNGAQITGLIAILSQVPAGLITKDGAAALIAASFPSINAAQITAILAGVNTSLPTPDAGGSPKAPPPPAPARSLPESRAMTISIDFDRTFAADPSLWGEFARQAKADGNTVVMVSRREDTPDDRQTVTETLGDYAEEFSQVLLVGGGTLKDDAAKAAGIEVDVWVDDSPQFVKRSESRECGANAEGGGGFQPGNKCAKGGASSSGTGSSGSGSSGSTAQKKLSDGEYAQQVSDRLTRQGFSQDKHQKYIDYYMARRDSQPEWYKSLSHAEEERVWFWVGSGYRDVRDAQKNGKDSPMVSEWESAIQKAPEVDGDFYRGLSGWNLTQSDIDQYKPGAVITLEADSSASKSQEYATDHSSKLTYVDPEDAGEPWTKERRPGLVLKFEGVKARDISGLRLVSMNQGNEPPKESTEKEVIIRRGGSYKVVSVNGRNVVLRPTK